MNNGQTTGAGYALDARYGKTLYDLYAQLNADLGNGRYTSDLMVPQPSGAVLAWNGNTHNTPFKAGLTLSSEGIALVTGDYSFWQVVLAVPRGETKIYLHSTNAGIPTGWKSVQFN